MVNGEWCINMAEEEMVETTPVELCRALLDEDRLLILGRLALGGLTVDGLLAELPPRSAAALRLNRHLQQLQQIGLVVIEYADGAERYTLAVKQIHAFKRQLFSRGDADQAQSTEEKTLAAFVKNDQLVQLPVQPAKLLLVLRWLVQRFEVGQDYPEKAVNEILGGHEVDYATLRRLLIDHGLLVRAAGIYRRVGEA